MAKVFAFLLKNQNEPAAASKVQGLRKQAPNKNSRKKPLFKNRKSPLDILDIREYNEGTRGSIKTFKGGILTARPKLQTLTEQMFYTLLCLKEECYGMDILDRVPKITKGRVSIGSGTLYTLLEEFLALSWIRETRTAGRRRCYLLTEKGEEILKKEADRLQAQLADYKNLMQKEGQSR